MSYQPLTDDDVLGLFADVTRDLSVPLVVYDNPGTTHVVITDELHGRIAALPSVASVKIPALPADPEQAAARVTALRRHLPDHVTIGISGDASAVVGLTSGCQAWYSVVGGTLPHVAVPLTRSAQTGDSAAATAESARLQPLWDLFRRHGSLRVVAAIAEQHGWAHRSCLPLPLRGLDDRARADVAAVVERLGLTPPLDPSTV
jgi:4-hydroxy-tetrahydrodipicolinate synthase